MLNIMEQIWLYMHSLLQAIHSRLTYMNVCHAIMDAHAHTCFLDTGNSCKLELGVHGKLRLAAKVVELVTSRTPAYLVGEPFHVGFAAVCCLRLLL